MALSRRLVALAVVCLAASLVVATGAFTSVSATRTVSVDVASDDAALLQLAPHSGPNGDFAQLVDGELELSFDDVPSDGVNPNATTTIEDVFNVTNQGTQPVNVTFTEVGNYTGRVTFESAGGDQLDGGAAGVTLPVGETVEVTITIDTTGLSLPPGTSLIDSITIRAEASA
jgi:hypothetical protein